MKEHIELEDANDQFEQRMKDLNAQNMPTVENNAEEKEGSYVISYTLIVVMKQGTFLAKLP